jgi:hypothetical protein
MIYEHTQRGGFVLLVLGIVALILIINMAMVGKTEPIIIPTYSIVLGVMALVAYMFGSLTAEVSREQVLVKMGPGLIRRTFVTVNISSATTVRNKWYYGFGVRRTPHAWMFNVSGLDAIEITLKTGSRFRIGTDEPDRLQRAIERAIQGSN